MTLRMKLDSFLSYFYEEYNEIIDQLNNLTENKDHEQKFNLSAEYKTASYRAKRLQKFFNDNLEIIPQHEKRKALDNLSELQRLIPEKSTEISPIMNFGLFERNINHFEILLQTIKEGREKRPCLLTSAALISLSSQQDNTNSPHKRAKRVTSTECDLFVPKEDKLDSDPIDKIFRIGFLDKYN